MLVSKFRHLCYCYVALNAFGISRLSEVSANLCSVMHIWKLGALIYVLI